MRYIVEYDVDMALPLPPDSLWTELLVNRTNFQMNPENTKLEEDKTAIFTMNKNVVCIKSFDCKKSEMIFKEKTNDCPESIWFTIPANNKLDSEYKDKVVGVISTDTIMFWYYKYITKDTTKEEIERLKLLPKNAVVNVLKRKTNKRIEISRNDVLIDGKKFIGSETSANKYGVFDTFVITFNYDEISFNTFLNATSTHKTFYKNRDITGIGNEIPEYTKKEFIEDFIKEHKLLLR